MINDYYPWQARYSHHSNDLCARHQQRLSNVRWRNLKPAVTTRKTASFPRDRPTGPQPWRTLPGLIICRTYAIQCCWHSISITRQHQVPFIAGLWRQSSASRWCCGRKDTGNIWEKLSSGGVSFPPEDFATIDYILWAEQWWCFKRLDRIRRDSKTGRLQSMYAGKYVSI